MIPSKGARITDSKGARISPKPKSKSISLKMSRLRNLLNLISLIFSLLALSSFTVADDAAVMSKFLAALSPAPSNWYTTTDCCNWKNVICDKKTGRVTSIKLAFRSLSGTLPSDLGTLTQLTYLSLQGNSFSGPIPSLSTLNSLQQLYLDNNNFTCIPTGFFQGLTSLQTLTLSQNINLEPWTIPTELTQVTSLVALEASYANIFGSLPDFNKLTRLRYLYLSDNNLSGSIPDGLAKLTSLQVLDVSNNNLVGSIPNFKSTVMLNTIGNTFLGTRSSGTSVPPVVIAVIVILVVVFLFFIIWFVGGRNRVGDQEKGEEVVKNSKGVSNPKMVELGTNTGRVPKDKNTGRVPKDRNKVVGSNLVGDLEKGEEVVDNSKGVPEDKITSGVPKDRNKVVGSNLVIPIELLRRVTNNFSKDNILGSGGFADVYKGELGSEGFGDVYNGELGDQTSIIAVKRLNLDKERSKIMKQFEAEVAVLTKVRHKNLVALLGYCINDNESLLVLEYMPKGTLTKHLFNLDENGCSLTWEQRIRIALDVAHGVEYLHDFAPQRFIHRDLKPSNILLGDDMTAKVADFGLVKHVPDGKHSIETQLAGTRGYLAPEYAVDWKVTTKVDLYAFGVVLMQLITGREAIDTTNPDEWITLVTWFHRILNDKNIPIAIDHTLNANEETMKSIYEVAELARKCTERDPHKRPVMGEAVNILRHLVNQHAGRGVNPTSQRATANPTKGAINEEKKKKKKRISR